jgi:hypothetical protein
MAWATKSTTTKHTCNRGKGPVFGKKTPGCPRCEELLAGAAPVRFASWDRKKQFEAMRIRAISQHSCSRSGCGPVCTAFDY